MHGNKIIPKDQFVRIYAGLASIGVSAHTRNQDIARARAMVDSLLGLNGVSREDLLGTVEYYTLHQNAWRQIIGEAAKALETPPPQ